VSHRFISRWTFSRCRAGTSSVRNLPLSAASFFISISVEGKLRSDITADFSLIHVCSIVASSRYSFVFVCDSESYRGCSAGGSGNTSYSDEMYVMMDFSSIS